MSKILGDEFERIGSQQVNDVQFKTIKVDVKRFEKYLEDPDMSEAQKEEFLNTLLSIVLAFVDMGLGVHPVQQACEQKEIYDEICTLNLADLLESGLEENSTVKTNSGSSEELVSDGRQE